MEKSLICVGDNSVTMVIQLNWKELSPYVKQDSNRMLYGSSRIQILQ
jgi:hypothetical protein